MNDLNAVMITTAIALTAPVLAFILEKNKEIKEWNNGICGRCGNVLEDQGRTLAGEIPYACVECGNTIWMETHRPTWPTNLNGVVLIVEEK